MTKKISNRNRWVMMRQGKEQTTFTNDHIMQKGKINTIVKQTWYFLQHIAEKWPKRVFSPLESSVTQKLFAFLHKSTGTG